MRGKIYFQSAVLLKTIFVEGAKKIDRVNPQHEHYNCVASFKTMDSYRSVWNNLFNYLKEHWKLKNMELITEDHIEAYIEYKIEYYPSKQYLEKLSSALGKLEFALSKYSEKKYIHPIKYDFQIRQNILDNARDLNLVANNYHSRTYQNPQLIIDNLQYANHKLAATIQLQGGARSEAVTLIKKDQLKGLSIDKISNKEIGIIETKEKGGRVRGINIEIQTYKELEKYFEINNVNSFRIKYQKYVNDIKQACVLVNETPHGSHGYRWTFCRNRVREYQKYGYSYEQALQGVSWEMKHFRASITEHYLQ